MLSLDSRLTGSVIHIRPSMNKFDADDKDDLEICDMGTNPISLVLNRQMIKLLEDMGVSDDWFFKLQSGQLQYLRGITASDHRIARFLKHQSIGDSIGLHRLVRESRTPQLNYGSEPFLGSVIEAVVLRELRLLKHKARIPLRKGITLLGIMDETGYLQPDEVYVTYDIRRGRHSPPPPAGRLIVTRSPALHEGDIQFANNVIPPRKHSLRKHKNCIVFSSKGARDLPSQLSGGDLDGDLYNVLWDPEARPTQTFPPADYPQVEPVKG